MENGTIIKCVLPNKDHTRLRPGEQFESTVFNIDPARRIVRLSDPDLQTDASNDFESHIEQYESTGRKTTLGDLIDNRWLQSDNKKDKHKRN